MPVFSWPEAQHTHTKLLVTFYLSSTDYVSILYSLPDPHSLLTSSLHRIPQIPDSFSLSPLTTTLLFRAAVSATGNKCAAITYHSHSGQWDWLSCASYVKVLVKSWWRDFLQAERQEGMSGASLGRERNAIVPRPHPGETDNQIPSNKIKIHHLDSAFTNAMLKYLIIYGRISLTCIILFTRGS